MYIGLHVQCRLFLLDINEFSQQCFEKHSNNKFHEVQWEPNCSLRTDGQTEMTKRGVAFRKFAKRVFIINVLRFQRDSN
jgi:hypothetical protein